MTPSAHFQSKVHFNEENVETTDKKNKNVPLVTSNNSLKDKIINIT